MNLWRADSIATYVFRPAVETVRHVPNTEHENLAPAWRENDFHHAPGIAPRVLIQREAHATTVIDGPCMKTLRNADSVRRLIRVSRIASFSRRGSSRIRANVSRDTTR